MKFFLDSANLGEIREAAELGLIDGVTTNPSLIAREGGVDFKRHIAAVCEAVAGHVSAVRPPLSRFDGRAGLNIRCRDKPTAHRPSCRSSPPSINLTDGPFRLPISNTGGKDR